MKIIKNLDEYRSYVVRLEVACDTTLLLPSNPARGKHEFKAFIEYPNGITDRMAPLFGRLNRNGSTGRAVIVRPITFFDSLPSDAAFLDEYGELPAIVFDTADPSDFEEAWDRGVPPNGTYIQPDCFILDERGEWVIAFQFETSSGVILANRDIHLEEQLSMEGIRVCSSPDVALREGVVAPSAGFSGERYESFVSELQRAFSANLRGK